MPTVNSQRQNGDAGAGRQLNIDRDGGTNRAGDGDGVGGMGTITVTVSIYKELPTIVLGKRASSSLVPIWC